MSQNFMTGRWGEGLRYLFPVLAFAIGVVAAERIQSTFKYAKKLHWRQMIMCIGNLRSGTAALSVYCREKRPEQLKQALYYFGIIFFFAIGAGGGGNLSMRLGIPAIWVSDVLLLLSFILMFSSKHRD